uniref:Uncharacterized protein n=1 Tax=Aegilops tauschii subsp. strangulata TaxID=200361 RepID=A0A453LY08_AEGTS
SYCQGCEFFDELGIVPWKILSMKIQLLNTKGITCHVQVYSKVAFSQHLQVTSCEMSLLRTQGKIEDLVRIDLGSYAVGASEDCSSRLGDYISMDVLNAVQRTAPRGLLHHTETFDKDTCLLDFDVLLVEPRNIKRNLIDSVAFWTKAVNLANQRS